MEKFYKIRYFNDLQLFIYTNMELKINMKEKYSKQKADG